jgi:hypothetical protein
MRHPDDRVVPEVKLMGDGTITPKTSGPSYPNENQWAVLHYVKVAH